MNRYLDFGIHFHLFANRCIFFINFAGRLITDTDIKLEQNNHKPIFGDLNAEIQNAKYFCEKAGLRITFETKLSKKYLEIISNRSKDISSLHFVSVSMLEKRLSNGALIVYNDDIIVGHIFVHKHMLGKHPVFERCTLWVNNDYRKYHLGLLLMRELTVRFKDDYLVSIAKSPVVHIYNESLGMSHITLSQLHVEMIDTLEQIGKLRDEKRYKYYVNLRFYKAIKRLK